MRPRSKPLTKKQWCDHKRHLAMRLPMRPDTPLVMSVVYDGPSRIATFDCGCVINMPNRKQFSTRTSEYCALHLDSESDQQFIHNSAGKAIM
jgi:hypothetical protein